MWVICLWGFLSLFVRFLSFLPHPCALVIEHPSCFCRHLDMVILVSSFLQVLVIPFDHINCLYNFISLLRLKRTITSLFQNLIFERILLLGNSVLILEVNNFKGKLHIVKWLCIYSVPGTMLNITCILSYLVLIKITKINENKIM